MNILIVCNHYLCCSGRYASDAFTRLGHTVRHVGPAKGRDIWGLTLPAEYVWEPDYCTNFVPDLIVVMDSDPAVLDSTESLKHNARPVIVYGVDNHVRDYRRPWFDHYFVSHKSVSLMEWRDDMTWLPCASSIEFTPSGIPWEQRKFDVACLGVPYPQRVTLIDAMKRAGLKVVWGHGLVYQDFANIYRNSRVSLCVSAARDLAQRIFETGRLGCAVLSDPLPDLEQFDPNHPIVEYRNIDEAVELARSMQNRPDFGKTCAKWAESETWEKRAQVIIDW